MSYLTKPYLQAGYLTSAMYRESIHWEPQAFKENRSLEEIALQALAQIQETRSLKEITLQALAQIKEPRSLVEIVLQTLAQIKEDKGLEAITLQALAQIKEDRSLEEIVLLTLEQIKENRSLKKSTLQAPAQSEMYRKSIHWEQQPFKENRSLEKIVLQTLAHSDLTSNNKGKIKENDLVSYQDGIKRGKISENIQKKNFDEIGDKQTQQQSVPIWNVFSLSSTIPLEKDPMLFPLNDPLHKMVTVDKNNNQPTNLTSKNKRKTEKNHLVSHHDAIKKGKTSQNTQMKNLDKTEENQTQQKFPLIWNVSSLSATIPLEKDPMLFPLNDPPGILSPAQPLGSSRSFTQKQLNEPHNQNPPNVAELAAGTRNLWTEEEDVQLKAIIAKKYNNNNKLIKWPKVSNKFVKRNRKQCQERWYNNLANGLDKTTAATQEEIEFIVGKFHQLGTEWKIIVDWLRADKNITRTPRFCREIALKYGRASASKT